MVILAFGLYCASMCVTLYAGGYSGEAQAYDAERDQCIGMDLNDPVNTPDMIYNPTVSQ